ncbi:HNH endonuclease [Microcoleus sp. A006_D1]|uniref:HNH endonuclease n=1 Tax=Microcoleus sp. A006_D1 TaxID=3055267 RepID=UPI002FD1A25E
MGKYKTKTFLVHRLVAEQKLGRTLRSGEVVHHINHDSQDNHPENLEICSSSFVHAQHHRKREKKVERLIQINGLWF